MRALAAAVVLLVFAAPAAALPPNLLIDVPPLGTPLPADDVSGSYTGRPGVVSSDGRYVVFQSTSDGLLAGDDDFGYHIYRKDLNDGTVVQVDLPQPGATVAPGWLSDLPAISSVDGSVVVFRSTAPLDPADTNGGYDIYTRHITAADGSGVTTLQSCPAVGVCHGDSGVFVDAPAISGDGTVVAWLSSGALVAGDTDGSADVYVRQAGVTSAASVNDDGSFANAGYASGPLAVNTTGSRIAFATSEPLTSEGSDADGVTDVFVRVRVAGGTTRLISRAAVASGQTPPAIGGRTPTMSANGSRVAFQTSANVGADTNNADDIYWMPVGAPETSAPALVSAADQQSSPSPGPDSAPAISGDGSRVAFVSPDALAPGAPTDGRSRAFVRTLASPATTLASRAADGTPIQHATYSTAVDGGGDTVVFDYTGEPLAAGASTAQGVVYARRIAAGTTLNVSRPGGSAPFAGGAGDGTGQFGNLMSADHRYVVFQSVGLLLGEPSGGIFRRDLSTGQVERVDVGLGGAAPNSSAVSPTMSLDGTKVAFTSAASNLVAGDANGVSDVFVRDLAAGTTRAMSPVSSDVNGVFSPTISGNGNRVAFVALDALDAHDSTPFFDVYATDTAGGTPVLVSRKDGADTASVGATGPTISNDGNRITFVSATNGVVAGDTNNRNDIFVRDLASNASIWVSRPPDGVADEDSYSGAISADGNKVIFQTSLADLGDGDTDTASDIHLRDLVSSTFTWVSRKDGAGGGPIAGSFNAVLAPAGDKVLFVSYDVTVVTPDTNAGQDIFARDLAAATTRRVVARPDGTQPSARGVLAPLSVSSDGACAVVQTNDVAMVNGGYHSTDFNHLYLVALTDACVAPTLPGSPAPAPIATPPVAKDTTKPAISKLKLAKTTIRTRKATTKKGRKAPLGTTLSLTLSEDATVTVKIERRTTGRKVKSKCVKKTKANRKKKACTRYVKAGKTITAKGKKGANKISFKPKNLSDGRYRVAVTAKDAAGNTSSASHASFKVVH